jgi:hypothetical protein
MWGYLEFRQMELHLIMCMRQVNITKCKIKYDGQIAWLEVDTNAKESEKQKRLHGVGEQLRDAAANAAVTT